MSIQELGDQKKYSKAAVIGAIERWVEKVDFDVICLVTREGGTLTTLFREVARLNHDPSKLVMVPNMCAVMGCGCLVFTALRDEEGLDLRKVPVRPDLGNYFEFENFVFYTEPFDLLSENASPREIEKAVQEVISRLRQ